METAQPGSRTSEGLRGCMCPAGWMSEGLQSGHSSDPSGACAGNLHSSSPRLQMLADMGAVMPSACPLGLPIPTDRETQEQTHRGHWAFVPDKSIESFRHLLFVKPGPPMCQPPAGGARPGVHIPAGWRAPGGHPGRPPKRYPVAAAPVGAVTWCTGLRYCPVLRKHKETE